MGMNIPLTSAQQEEEQLRHRPSILLVGPPNVGKRSILKRLVPVSESFDSSIASSGVTRYGWTIDTKYYTANVCIWVFELNESEADDNLRVFCEQSEALVTVFDLSNSTSFEALQKWLCKVELQKFEIILCVGNKADRVPDHYGHGEYRRKLQKRGESSSDPHPEFWDYGIQQTEGANLLDDSESLEERRRSCMEWCLDHSIEYIEACAVNEDFDKCMSVDGDSQGLARIWGALSAHMWPGMIMKPQKQLPNIHSFPNVEESSSDESEVSIEYELLSNGSAEPWDGDEGPWSFASENVLEEVSVPHDLQEEGVLATSVNVVQWQEESEYHTDVNTPSSSYSGLSSKLEVEGHHQGDEGAVTDIVAPSARTENITETTNTHQDTAGTVENISQRQDHREEHSVVDIEQLMQEMFQMRENLRIMPDSYRREMAASLAMRMASMFNEEDGSDTE